MSYLHINELDKLNPLQLASVEGLWVPTEQILSCTAPVPSAPRRKWEQVIPWQLEDQLLESPESVHFVFMQDNSKEPSAINILAVSKKIMDDWLDNIRKLSPQVTILLPDFMALPWQEGQITVARRDDILIVRNGRYSGFAALPDLAVMMIMRLMRQSGEENITLGINACVDPASLPEQLQLLVSATSKIDWNGASDTGVNLLCGKYRQSDVTMPDNLRRWSISAALLILVIVLAGSNILIGNYRLEQEVADLHSRNFQQARVLFPGLTISEQDIRGSVEDYINNAFVQQRGLDSDALRVFQALDSAISSCNCSVTDIKVNDDGIELVFDGSSNEVPGNLSVSGYNSSINQTEDNRTVLVVHNRGQF